MVDAGRVANVSASYDRESQRYVDHVQDELKRVSLDRAGLRLFAELVGPNATTLDAGCGPGHIAAFLVANGLRVSGVDISPALIELATSSFPGLGFGVGRLDDLPVGDASVAAVVARHSVIHTEPDALDEVCAEFARVLAPGGRLYVSFFAADDSDQHGEAFDHAVCAAYRFDPNVVSAMLASHAIVEDMRLVRRPGPDERQISHATLIARRLDPRHVRGER